MKKFKSKLSSSIEIAIFAALSLILSYIPIYKLPQGGSVDISSFPILFISIKLGLKSGVLCGFLSSILQILISGPTIYHPVQGILDYPVAYSSLGLAGLNINPYIAIIIACFIRFLCHCLSGYIFFKEFLPKNLNPIYAVAAYNASYMLPILLLNIIIFYFLKKRIKIKRV